MNAVSLSNFQFQDKNLYSSDMPQQSYLFNPHSTIPDGGNIEEVNRTVPPSNPSYMYMTYPLGKLAKILGSVKYCMHI